MKRTMHCAEHSDTRNLIDSFTDEEIVDLWFSPTNGCTGELCREDAMIKVYELAGKMARLIMETLPNRSERLTALFKLQESCMWTCAGMRRTHAVSNILQKRQGVRDINEISCCKGGE